MHYFEKDGYLAAVVRTAEEMAALNPDDPAFVALHREARARAAELGQKSGLPEEVVQQVLGGVHDPGRFADLVAGYIDITPAQRQALLETLSVEERLRRVLVHLQRQIGVLDAQEDIKSRVQEELGDRQREMFLREQLKTIRKELGEDDESGDLEEAAREARCPRAAGDGSSRSRAGVQPPRADRPGVDGVPGHPHVPGDRGGACRGTRAPRITSTSPRRRASSMRTTTPWAT